MNRGDTSDDIKETFPEYMRTSMGVVASACKSAGISRQTYYRWRAEDPEFAKSCDESIDHAADFVESKLYKLIQDETPSAIIFYCKTKLKHRGYVERIETTGKDGGAIEATINYKPNKTDELILTEMREEMLIEAQNKLTQGQSAD